MTHETFFNHTLRAAISAWDRRRFVRRWRALGQQDRRWVPPYYPALLQAITPGREPFLTTANPQPIYLEAFYRRTTGQSQPGYQMPAIAHLEAEPVAATVLLDAPSQPGTGHLALLHAINHEESLERLLYELADLSQHREFIGPTALSAHLGAGALASHWHETPPLHTPYTPPYLVELLDRLLEPRQSSQLYHLPIPPTPPAPAGVAQLRPLEPARLANDLLPLLAAASQHPAFAPPDADEAAFLLRWLGLGPLAGWLAQVQEQPVGFVLLQADLASPLRAVHGGQNPLWQLWWRGLRPRPGRHGRLLWGGVLPAWRRQGIGRQLLAAAQGTGRALGWQTLSLGPVLDGSPAGAFLARHGAVPRQRYQLYHWSAPTGGGWW